MTDRLTAFTRAVLRFAPESSMEDAVDSLWLALQIERVHEQTSVPQVDGAESVASGTSLPAAAPEPLADTPVPPSSAPEHPPGVAAPPARKPEPISPGLLELPSAAKDAKSGLPFRTPTAAALPGKRDILQALRPLMRRVSSSRLRELDLHATLHQFSMEGILYPIERPSLERWFRLVVIIEDSQSMNLWREPIRELYALLSSCGAFCSVRGYQMSASPSLGFLPLGAAQGRRGAARLSALPGLVDPQGRTLLLWVSDCVSSAWADGTIASLLRGIENLGPQLVVQMLPEHLFERTALGAAVPVWLRQLVPGANNRQQEAEPQELFRGLEVEEGACVHIPVATLTPSSLRSWARMVTAAAGAWAPGYGLTLPPSSSGENVEVSSAISTEADSPAFDAEERVRRFRMSASPTARRLARLLSTFSRLSLPLLRLVRGALLQEARQHHEVEVVLSGLLEVLPGKEGTPAEPECAQYGFYPGVREALHELPLTPGHDPPPGDEEVLRAVSKYVAEHDGTTRGFMAVVSSLSALTQGSAKFATLGEELMRELGKRYSRLAPEKARQLIEWSTPMASGGGSGGGAGSLLPKLPEATQAAPVSQYVGVPRAAKRDQLVGQQGVVEEIRARLQSGQRAYIGQAVVIPGAGGLGKTQLAVEYVDRYGATYSGGVVWLQADGQLDMQLLVLAQEAGWFPAGTDPKLLLDLARQRLRSRPDCLLVFDNLEKLQDIQPYLPPSTASTHILATSRNVQEAFTPIELKLLPPELALKLLIQEAGRSPQGPAEQQAAQDIANRLAGLPLALELAGRRLRHRFGLKFSDYRRLLEEQGLEALPKVLAEPTATQSIDIRAVLQVSEQLLAESPLLRRVLNVLTYSGASAVGRSLLAALLGVSEVALIAPLALGDTLKLLELEPSSHPGEPSRPRIHGLVSEARRHYVKPADLDGGPAMLCDRLADWFASRRDDFAQLPAFEAELEALRTWQRYATEKRLLQQVRLLWLQAYPHFHHGQYAQATEWLTQALASTAAYPDLPQSQLADLHNDVGSCCDAEGKYDKALTHKLEALKIRQQCLDPAHPDVATNMDNIGPTYSAQGKYAEALDFQQRALELRKQSRGEAHPDVATSMNNIGTTYFAQGKYAEALDFQQKALELLKQSLGEAHPDVATSMNNIGTTYSAQGKYAEALDFEQKALELRKQSLGEANPDVATSMNNIGATYSAQGKYAEALDFKQKALELRKQSLGEAHPDVAISMNNIGQTYFAQGKYAESLDFQQKALELLKQSLGEAHPDVATSMNNIGVTYFAQGKYAEALDFQQKALELRKQSLGEAHPAVATSMNSIGQTYFAQGKYAEALKNQQAALSFYRKLLGEGHPNTGHTRANIGVTYLKLNDAKQGWKELQQGVKILKAGLGVGHPGTVGTVKAIVALSRQHRGALIAQQLLADFLAELPPEHSQRAELEALQVGRPGVASQPSLAKPVTAKPAVPTAGPVVSVPLGNPLELTIGHVRAACARLTTADAQGTGYLVRPDRLVTCAHVVGSVGIGGNVQAQFIGNAQVVDVTVESRDDTADWAILKLAAPVEGTQDLQIFAASTVDARWLAFGYPAMAGEHGIALGGVVREPAGKDSLGRPAIQLFSDEAAAAHRAVLGGASGSPVLSGGRVIGHLRRLLPDEENRAQLGMLFACPSLAYQSALPALSEAPQLQTLGPQSSYDPLWYIPRMDAEKEALNKLSKAGIPVTLQAPEGYGKSWMVQRLLERIAQQDLTTGHKTEVVRLNLRKAMSPAPASLEALLMSLLRNMLEQLGVERLEALLARASKVRGDAKRKFCRALEQHVLSRGAHRSLIILEEADHLHRTPLQTDFFALLRALAEDKTPVYKSLRLLVTIGAEAAFLETTDHSAFFALSKPIVLEGFSFPQLQSEAALYGLSADDHGLRELHRLTSGYPQYAQQAMHEAVCSEKTLAEVLTTTDPRGGLFASSLQRLRLYIEREGLRPVLQKLLAAPRLDLPPNDYLRLYRKGLVMETSPGEYRLRCPLFDDYFRAWCR